MADPAGELGAGDGRGPHVAANAPFSELFIAYAPFVLAMLRREGVTEIDLPDQCQDVFVVLLRHLDWLSAEADGSLRSWLYSVVRHQAANYRRWARRRRHTDVDLVEVAALGVSPEMHVAGREALAALEMLPEMDRDVLARVVEGRPASKIEKQRMRRRARRQLEAPGKKLRLRRS